MSKYKGLFTFDVDSHIYIPVEQADGLISDMNYRPGPEEELKEYCYITGRGNFHFIEDIDDEGDKERKQIGNYFETKEEAEKAVEKLKAWKRLKDKGFQITGWDNSIGDDYYKTGQIVLNLNNVKNTKWDEYEQISEIKNDLNLLFGGEE